LRFDQSGAGGRSRRPPSGTDEGRVVGNLTHGMTVGEVEDLGRILKQQGHVLEQLSTQIDSKVHGSSWAGGDADRFRGDWWPMQRRRLSGVAADLDGLGQAALNNAAEQRRVSGSDSSGSSGGTRRPRRPLG